MRDWIKAYWAYRLEKGKQETIVKIKLDWFELLFWLGVLILVLHEHGVIK